MQPNVPGIFALIYDLEALMNAEPPHFPKKGRHIPVGSGSSSFSGHLFPDLNDRSASESWYLTSAGLEYPCEADSKFHEGYAERLDDFGFPQHQATDDLSSTQSFLGMTSDMAWFAQVKDVAACVAVYCNGSGTLADCSASGIAVNQLIVNYMSPETIPSVPTRIADPKSLFPFSFQLSTTARSLPQLAETIAAQAQTSVRMFKDHPYAGNFGDSRHRQGAFWNIQPIEKSDSDYESYLGLAEMVRLMLKSRV
jgi:hypothetical protein